MAELNLKQVIDRLDIEFIRDTRKLVFWCDDNGKLAEDMKDMRATAVYLFDSIDRMYDRLEAKKVSVRG